MNDVVAKLDSCEHAFCFNCISEWSKVTNKCPLCKERFDQITKYSKDGKKLSAVRVKLKDQVPDAEPEYEILEGKKPTTQYGYNCI